MLSSTAENLFWMSRYVERMDFIARLLDAGRRLDALPRREGTVESEWTSVLIASGSATTFPDDPQNATAASVCHHLIRDPNNPSSIMSCITAARFNTKAVRSSVTSEVWEAINQTRSELQRLIEQDLDVHNLSAFLDKVRGRSIMIGGAATETMIRDDRHGYMQLGKWLERADSTARLLDVKYNVLLPKASDVGGGLDYLQWLQILRAANSAGAFRHIYGRSIDSEGVVDMLVLNSDSPRSLRTSLSHVYGELQALATQNSPPQQDLLHRVRSNYTQLMNLSVEDIFAQGLHEWLTAFIVELNKTSLQTATVFGFGPATIPSSS